ncbi:MAG: hypothetical protein CSA81_02585 [Acidobacteria bacterium]|nr:MAG: hypothetical protein CSA81_02585 [Acidobacteriota bacterium]PIE90575.1 MAG: hypothetical protein CR997_05660 [Acidobacteriota bacterium]
MKKGSLAIVLMIFTLTLFAQNEANRATELYKKGKYKEAITLLEEAIATNPDWYFPVLLKSNCNMKLGNYQAALDGYKFIQSMEIPDKEIPKVKFFMGQCYMRLGKQKEAIELFNGLTKSAPENKKFDMYFSVGQAEVQVARDAQKKKNNKTAHSYYSKAISSFTNALKYPASDEKRKINAAFQKAYSQFKIGNLQGSQDSLQKSISYFKDVLKIDPKHEQTHELLVEVSFRLAKKAKGKDKVAKYAQCVIYLDGYLKYWPNDVKMLDKKGQALLGVKRYSEAVSVFKKVVAKSPNDGNAYFSLGRAEMADRQYNTAIGTFKKAMAKGAGKNPYVYSFSAHCYIKQKTKCTRDNIPLYQKAVDVLNQGLKAIPGNSKLQAELDSKKENLDIFKTNYETEESNRKALIDNIKSLDQNIAGNTSKLEREREKQLKQNTEAIEKSIANLKQQIKEARSEKEAEVKALRASYDIAKACGGAQGTAYYSQMQAVLKANGAL